MTIYRHLPKGLPGHRAGRFGVWQSSQLQHFLRYGRQDLHDSDSRARLGLLASLRMRYISALALNLHCTGHQHCIG